MHYSKLSILMLAGLATAGVIRNRDSQRIDGLNVDEGSVIHPTSAATESSVIIAERAPQVTGGVSLGGPATQAVNPAPVPTQANKRDGEVIERDPQATPGIAERDPQPAPSPLKRQESGATPQVIEREPQATGAVIPGGPVTQVVNPAPVPTRVFRRQVQSTLRILQRTAPQETAIAAEDAASS